MRARRRNTDCQWEVLFAGLDSGFWTGLDSGFWTGLWTGLLVLAEGKQNQEPGASL